MSDPTWRPSADCIAYWREAFAPCHHGAIVSLSDGNVIQIDREMNIVWLGKNSSGKDRDKLAVTLRAIGSELRDSEHEFGTTSPNKDLVASISSELDKRSLGTTAVRFYAKQIIFSVASSGHDFVCCENPVTSTWTISRVGSPHTLVSNVHVEADPQDIAECLVQAVQTIMRMEQHPETPT